MNKEIYKKEAKRNYTGYGREGINYKEDLSTKDIAKLIRKKLKEEFKDYKFSVRYKSFAGGSEIEVSLMKTNFEIYNKEYKEDKNGNVYTERDYEYAQLNHYTLLQDKWEDSNGYCNGVYLTEKAWKVLKRVVEIAESYNYNDSDSMIDYFDTQFYFHLEIGQWNKPYEKQKYPYFT